MSSNLATRARGLTCFVLASACLQAVAGEALFKNLKGAQITAALSGKQVTDDHHWAHHYLPDGRVMLQESGHDRPGKWSVQHDQLCLIKPQFSKTEPLCYAVQRQDKQLRYVDERQRGVYEGFVRGRADAHLFDGGGKR